jgi:hypothetical protein
MDWRCGWKSACFVSTKSWVQTLVPFKKKDSLYGVDYIQFFNLPAKIRFFTIKRYSEEGKVLISDKQLHKWIATTDLKKATITALTTSVNFCCNIKFTVYVLARRKIKKSAINARRRTLWLNRHVGSHELKEVMVYID